MLAPPDGQPTVLTAVRGTQTTATPAVAMLAVTMLTAEMLAPLDVQPAGAGHSSCGNAGNGNAGSRNRCQGALETVGLLPVALEMTTAPLLLAIEMAADPPSLALELAPTPWLASRNVHFSPSSSHPEGDSTPSSTEWYGISKRSFSIILTHAAFSVGLMVLAGMAYGVRECRALQLGLSVPLALTGIFFCILPESARWLLTQGKQEEAKKLILKAASMEVEKSGKTGTVLDLFRLPRLRRITLIMSYIWFVTSLVYDGLGLNVGNFGLNIYLTQFIFGLVEIPACIGSVPLLENFGRRKCQGAVLLLGGTACLLIIAIPAVPRVSVVASMFSAVIALSSVIFAKIETWPVVKDWQTGVGLVSMSARVGGIIAPLIRLLEVYHSSIPLVIYGVTPLIGSVLYILLPETLNTELPDHTYQTDRSHQ
ncbi:UNVERIFIED_CONTAM: hypothetical protein FKN15_053513 [Acipenser sinensis]